MSKQISDFRNIIVINGVQWLDYVAYKQLSVSEFKLIGSDENNNRQDVINLPQFIELVKDLDLNELFTAEEFNTYMNSLILNRN